MAIGGGEVAVAVAVAAVLLGVVVVGGRVSLTYLGIG